MRRTYLAALLWGWFKHPQGKQSRIHLRSPLKLRTAKQTWNNSILLSIEIRAPMFLWVPSCVIAAYGEAVLGDPDWDLPF